MQIPLVANTNHRCWKKNYLQEFMPRLRTWEKPLLYFNKIFSHSVNKNLKGDFRIQIQFGGKYILFNPQAIWLKKHKIDGSSRDLLYARVDGIIIDDQLHLMEVECIEPDLYLNLSDGALRFTTGLSKRFNRNQKSTITTKTTLLTNYKPMKSQF
jgi:hypothetical protein